MDARSPEIGFGGPRASIAGARWIGRPSESTERSVVPIIRRPLQRRARSTRFPFLNFFIHFVSTNIPYFHSFFTHLSTLTQHLSIQYLSFTHFSKMFPKEDIGRAMKRAMFAFGNQILTGNRAIQE